MPGLFLCSPADSCQKRAGLQDARNFITPTANMRSSFDSCYSRTHCESALCLVGSSRSVDPVKHFVVLTTLLSDVLSSSSSNTSAPFERVRFARMTRHPWCRATPRRMPSRYLARRVPRGSTVATTCAADAVIMRCTLSGVRWR
jgi:hypothetical protein